MNFTQAERSASSGERELLALVFTLRHWLRTRAIAGCNIYWLTDSTNLVSFIQKGSGKPNIQPLAFEVAMMCSELELNIIPIHMFREDPRLQWADEGSKAKNTDNWSLSYEDFQWFLQWTSFDTDLFADRLNRQADQFCSLFYEEGSLGVDCFSLNWAMLGNLWLCPPVSALIKVYRKIMASRCTGVIVMPEWFSSNFLAFFVDKEGQAKEPFKMIRRWKPVIIQNEQARNTALFGPVKFDFIALSF